MKLVSLLAGGQEGPKPWTEAQQRQWLGRGGGKAKGEEINREAATSFAYPAAGGVGPGEVGPPLRGSHGRYQEEEAPLLDRLQVLPHILISLFFFLISLHI